MSARRSWHTSSRRGSGEGRSLIPMRTPAHRATTRNLQALYPFVVDSGLGTRGVYVGRQTGSDASFVHDPWQQYHDGVVTNPNMLLAGVIGRGKSALAKSLALRMTAFGVRVYVPGDPKGEWCAVARAIGVEPITLGRGLPARINPLDAGPRPHGMAEDSWRREIEARRLALLAALAETTLDRRLTPVERTALVLAIQELNSPGSSDAPVLPAVVASLMAPTTESARSLNMSTHALISGSRDLALELRRLVVGDLAGLFDGPTTRGLDFDAPIQVLDTSRLAGDDTAIALLMTCASAWMESALVAPDGGRRLVVYDEAWRMLRHLALVRRMQSQWKLSRALGVANLAVVHRISDLGAVGASGSEAVALAHGLLADCSTRIVYAQETDQVDATAAALGLTDVEAEQLVHLPRGRGLWKIGRHSAIVDHILGDEEEAAIVDTDARMRTGGRP
jgi:type IV secretory pathway VirB4 component